MYNFSYLQDSDFLHEFNKNRNKEQLIKVTILDWKNESPLEEITGSVVDGSISIDGSSAMRRTANISLLLNDYDYNLEDINNIISINKKVEIMIGFVNNTDKYTNYPVLWFPQGIYLIISASITHDSSGIKASLTLHDKMALLNGECGGIIPAATVFNEIENEDDYGNISKEYPTIVQIIQQLVNHFGNEQLGKIIIKDLQPIVKQVLKWNGDSNTSLFVYLKNAKDYIIDTLSYSIYKYIFKDIYEQKKNTENKTESQIEQIFFKILGVQNNKISILKDILLNLSTLQQSINDKSEKIELWKNNLEKLQKILTTQNFSLIKQVKSKIKELSNILRRILKQIKKELKFSPNEILKNYFGSESYKSSIFSVDSPRKIYDKIVDFKSHCSILRTYCRNNYSTANPNEILSLIIFLLHPENMFKVPTFEILPGVDFNTGKQENSTFVISLQANNNGVQIPIIKNKETNTIVFKVEKNSNFINNLSEKIFKTSFWNPYCFLSEWISIREIFQSHNFYTDQSKSKAGYFDEILFQILRSFATMKGINSIDPCLYILEGFEYWCDSLLQVVSILINTQSEILNNANNVKQNLLNNSFIKEKISFYNLLQTKMNELENLINNLPIKKTFKDGNDIITVQYRQQAQSLFKDFYEDIFSGLYYHIQNLDLKTYPTDGNDYKRVSTKFTSIAQPFSKQFDYYIGICDYFVEQEDIFKNYFDTTKEINNHKIIDNGLKKIKKYFLQIEKYKQYFTKKSLIQLQEWLNTTDFSKNDLELSILSQNFNSSFIKELQIPSDNNTDMKNDSNSLLKQFTNLNKTILNNNSTKNIQINTKFLEAIIKQLQLYVNDNTQNTNTDLGLNEQILQYKQKVLQLIIIENNNIDRKIKQQNFNYNNDKTLEQIFNKFLKEIQRIQIFQQGQDIGYTLTDFTYPGSLTAAAGETVTSILDKIKNTLGNYQYFYDINGNFIFQQVRNYLNKSYSTYMLEENASSSFNLNNTNGKYIYNFNDGEIIQSYSNNINYQDIKNDFIVWGQRKTTDGKKYPIRYHLAIDTKPAVESVYFIPIDKNSIKTYLSVSDFPIEGKNKEGENKIYYYALQENEFYKWVPPQTEEYKNSTFFGYKKTNIKIKKCDSKEPENGKYSKDTYYYQINQNKELSVKYSKNGNAPQICNYPCFYVNDYRTELYLDGVLNEPLGLYSNEYYTELKTEWPKLFNFNQGVYYSFVKKNPDNIDYYLDLLSTNNLTSQYGISLIGKRTQIITNNSINCIFQPTCPDYVFNISKEKEDINKMINKNQSKTDQDKEKTELLLKRDKVNNYFNQWNEKNLLSQFSKKIDVKYDIYKNFANGGTARSAYEEIRSVLYQYLTYNEQISLTTIPIYYLQPNNLIQVNDAKSNISGSYLVKSISLPLGGNGTMTISCSKAIEKV